MVRTALGLCLAAFACTGGAADFTRDIVDIPLMADTALPAERPMVAGVFRPPGDGPFPVLVYSHGRAGTAIERGRTRVPEARGHVRYWLARGFAVVEPIRPGYGDAGGTDREDSGVRYDLFGNCWGRPAFARSAAAAADAVLATLEWLRHQPWADAKRVVLAGASMGGLASIASAATHPDGVVAYINFSGGTGGSGTRAPEQSCGSAEMQALMAAYGTMVRIPSLWLYAENDRYWGSEWPRAWHRAYAAGGEPTRFVMTQPVADSDGHQLLARGTRLWMVHVDRFLDDLGL
jgi:dienelactone hydrolase